MQYDNTNSGFSRKAEKTEDWHDDFKGTIDVEGKAYFLGSRWYPAKDGKEGFFKHKLRAKTNQQDRAPQAPVASSAPAMPDDFAEDLPW